MLDYKRLSTNGDGDGAAFLIGTDADHFAARLKQAAGPSAQTPTPGDEHEGGPIRRFTDQFSPLGLGTLEHVGLSGHEIADAVQTRVQELFRNEFPIAKPRFEVVCTDCGAEYQSGPDECPECGGQTRDPDPAEKRRLEQLLESVNKEGQSLRDIAKAAEFDQWFLGVPVLVLRHTYQIATTDSRVADAGDIVASEPEELVKGDPKRIVPVVDENRRIGGYWWACPRCRGADNYHPVEHRGRCDDCGAGLREVYFAEFERSYRGGASDQRPDAVYYREEILTYPYAFPRLHGLDGLSPVHHGWLKQLLIEFQESYATAFYDPDSDRLPNQFMILHTTNPQAWEERLQQARADASDDVYDSPIFANEYSPQDNSTPEVQVVDAMPDELLGQNETLTQRMKEDIRQIVNVTDIYDSDLSDAGGLNNEGLQLEVTNRSIADQMRDYQAGWLDTLAKRLGITDYRIGFLPGDDQSGEDLQQELRAALMADQAGLDPSFEDGRAVVPDGDVDARDTPPDGQPPAAGDTGGDFSRHDFGPTDPMQSARQRPMSPTLHKATAGDRDLALLEAGHKHVIWPDLATQKAREPYFGDDADVPEFVRDVVQRALDSGAVDRISSALPDRVTRFDVREFFADKLTQPQGWSLQSLTEDYADRFDVPASKAVRAVRTQTASILNKAREIGYRAKGLLTETEFIWQGPQDNDVTQACTDLKQAANPEFGGEPKSLSELKALIDRTRREHYPDYSGAEWTVHWNERHTFVEWTE